MCIRESPYPEIAVTPEIRQEGYEKFVTTAAHLMHITGIAKDQNGTWLLYTSKQPETRNREQHKEQPRKPASL